MTYSCTRCWSRCINKAWVYYIKVSINKEWFRGKQELGYSCIVKQKELYLGFDLSFRQVLVLSLHTYGHIVSRKHINTCARPKGLTHCFGYYILQVLSHLQYQHIAKAIGSFLRITNELLQVCYSQSLFKVNYLSVGQIVVGNTCSSFSFTHSKWLLL